MFPFAPQRGRGTGSARGIAQRRASHGAPGSIRRGLGRARGSFRGGPKLPLRSPTRPNPFLAKNLGFPSGGTPSVTSNNLTLHVKGIPRELPGKALVEHFAKFGKIDKIERNLSKLYATVTYANHESAVKAKGLGKCIKHDQDEFLVHMFWHAGSSKSTTPSSLGKESSSSTTAATTAAPTTTTTPLTSSSARPHGLQQPNVSTIARSSLPSATVAVNPFKRQNPLGSPKRLIAKRPTQSIVSPDRISEDVEQRSEANFHAATTNSASQISTASIESAAAAASSSSSEMQRDEPTAENDSMKTFDSGGVGGVGLRSRTKPLVASYSAAERYEELKKRDNQMRQAVVKDTSIQSAQAVVGSCPDMCPEKERYERESQRKYSYFELSFGSEGERYFDHRKAVKEYSRSSADKEEPLPHEIRPPSVLNLTMNYLVTQIMDQSKGRWSEWFDFVWNRTRAIRKDLTQQHICSVDAVDLTEKATRFHVFSAHCLCEEDLRSFDPKINNENLTKCLQSLKQYYADLNDLQNVRCSSEAEFRAYSILLQLDQGDVLREVLTLSPAVRQSTAVKFALAVHSAYSSNNYVRFFRLVRRATYLNACILHRYFQQIRASALKTIVRGHSIPKGETRFPLQELVKLLAFEDENDAANFCVHYGLDAEDGSVIFTRNQLTSPTEAFPIQRAEQLIESKRTCSIGEVVYGGSLPAFGLHEPHSSFGSSKPTTIYVPEVKAEPQEEKIVTKEILLETAENILVETVHREVTALAEDVHSEVGVLKNVANSLWEAILGDVVVKLCGEAARETITVEQQKRDQMLAIGQAICHEANQMVNSTIASLTQQIAKDVLREALNSHLDALTVRKVGEEVSDTVIDSCVHIMAMSVSHESINEERSLRRECLNRLSQRSVEMRRARYFNHWRRLLQARQQLRERLYRFPVGPSLISPEIRASRLRPSHSLSSSPGKRAKMSDLVSGYDIGEALEREGKRAHQARELLWHPYDFAAAVHRQVQTKWASSSSRIYWKMCVSLPAALPQDAFSWILSKFFGGNYFVCGTSKIETCHHVTAYKNSTAIIMGLKGDLSAPLHVNQKLLSGTVAFLFVVGPFSLDLDIEFELSREGERLKQILTATKRSLPARSLFVLNLSNHVQISGTTLAKCLSISDLLSSELITSFRYLNFGCNVGHSEEFHESLESFVALSAKPFELTCEDLRDFVEAGLFRLFIQPLFSHGGHLELKDVGLIISIYNETLEHLANLAGGRHLARYSWPPEEVAEQDSNLPPTNWNSSERLQVVQDAIRSLTIQNWLPTSMGGDNVKDQCLHFIQELGLKNSVYCFVRVSQLLETTMSSSHLPWAKIFQVIVNSKISSLSGLQLYSDQFGVPSYLDDRKSGYIYYLSSALKEDRLLEMWKSVPRDLAVLLGQYSSEQINATNSIRLPRQRERPTESFHQRSLTVHSATSECLRAARSTSTKLRRSLDSAQQDSAEFENRLSHWLDAGSSVVALGLSTKKAADEKPCEQKRSPLHDRSPRLVGEQRSSAARAAGVLSRSISELRHNVESERRFSVLADLQLKRYKKKAL
ncbi:germinal-center associated nuclear protein-like [Oscarella lobularis]|uniref:germinal-center associated nuclear protein-like n=1 Tax=Oscarella lobularis TaxID=121494 RepID=UPI0033132107